LELELPRQGGDSGGDEGNAHGDGVDELHISGLVDGGCWLYALTDRWMKKWCGVYLVFK
jgi:hypothetical protein